MPRSTESVAAGRVVTPADPAAHRAVAPRRVARILAALAGMEAATPPSHRAGAPKAGPDGVSQRALLAAQGLSLDPSGRIAHLAGQAVTLSPPLRHR